jgi:hypothetical protein
VLLTEEELEVEGKTYEKIVELFDLMHPQKRVLESTDDLGSVSETKASRVETYADIIHPPSFSVVNDVPTITFWTIDYWTGDLEQWNIVEGNLGEISIEGEVLEVKLIRVLS